MRDKRDVMRLHIQNGIRGLDGIIESYNTYSQGGNLYRGTTKKSNQMEFSFAPDKYSTIPQAQLAPTVKQRQAIERNKFLQTNPTFQQPISKPTGSEKAGQFMHDVGSRMLNAITTFGGSAIGDVINDISPEVANTVSKYSFGMVQPTSQEYLESNRNGQWGNRINNSANAISSQMAGELVGAGINKAMPYIAKGVESIGKEALEKSMPYLTGESKIPMSGYKPKQEFWNPFSKDIKNNLQSHVSGDDAIKMFNEYGGEPLGGSKEVGKQLMAYVPEARRMYGLVGNNNISDTQIAESLYKHAKSISNSNSPKVGFRVGYDNGSTVLNKSANPIEHLFESREPG